MIPSASPNGIAIIAIYHPCQKHSTTNSYSNDRLSQKKTKPLPLPAGWNGQISFTFITNLSPPALHAPIISLREESGEFWTKIQDPRDSALETQGFFWRGGGRGGETQQKATITSPTRSVLSQLSEEQRFGDDYTYSDDDGDGTRG